MCIDLHTHSVFSDGTATPAELVEMAAELRLRALAITDHDTTEGSVRAVALGRENGVNVIPGIEISCMHREFSLHILGYGIDPEHPLLLEKIGRIQEGRQERNTKILARLAEMGISITPEELEGFSACGQAGRPHIARLLMEKGVISDLNTAFRLYIGKGKPAYANRFCFTAAETIDFLHRAGGVAVLAHPGKIDPAMKLLPSLVRELAERGLDGLEIIYPSHLKKVQKKLRKLAKKYNLIETGGSDYHGGNRPGSMLAGGSNGFCPPDELLAGLEARIASIRS
jgi:predicted metal-dependent phosphoesterase TrpH